MFITGFAMATSTRVSNSLGAGLPRAARRAAWTAVAIAVALELAAGGSILALRHSWARLFTDAPAVVALTAGLLPVFALTLPGDGANAVLQGLLRGSGRQETGAITNLCSYWLLVRVAAAAALLLLLASELSCRWMAVAHGSSSVAPASAASVPPGHPLPPQGIPSAAFLAFKRGLGVYGLWWGLVIVNTVQARPGSCRAAKPAAVALPAPPACPAPPFLPLSHHPTHHPPMCREC